MMMTFQFFLLIALSFKVVSTNTLPPNRECLDITNLDEILQALEKQNFEVARWRDLCLVLGIYIPTLNGIEATNQHHGVDRCLQECLSSWLSKADKVKQKGGPTWHSLIVGLKRIDQIATADKINGIHKNKHPACEILDQHISDPTVQKNLLSLGIIYLLHAEKIVTKGVWSSEELELLLNDVQNAVCRNYQLLKTF
uniref:Death domain-containing protein n=1 Tax=Amphimedon queenslandica TaxID=400682 RepID=A0A1X7SJF0_AMPQE